MRIRAQSFALRYIEAQMVSLVRGGVFITMQQDDKSDRALNGHRDICVGNYSHAETSRFHGEGGAAGQDESIQTIYDDLTWGHFDVRAARLIGDDYDGAEIRTMLLVTPGRRWCTNQLPVYSHT